MLIEKEYDPWISFLWLSSYIVHPGKATGCMILDRKNHIHASLIVIPRLGDPLT